MQRYGIICISPNFFVPLSPDNNIQIKILMRKITLLLLSLFALSLSAQVTTIPSIIQKGYDGEVTIIFNPNEGNKGMVGATQCYAHTGVTYDGTQWQHAPTWCSKLDKHKMSKNADGNWELKITPNIHEYYGVKADKEITQLCFVFNDGISGGKEGKADGNADIFVDLVDDGLAVMFTKNMPEISKVNDEITIECVATEEAQLTLTVNGENLTTETGKTLIYTYTLPEVGEYVFTITAKTSDEIKTAKVNTCVVSAPLQEARPKGIDMGIYYNEDDPTKLTLATYAAGKQVKKVERITLKAKMPAHWNNVITAWVWPTGGTGKEIIPTKEGEWYVVTENTSELNIIFKNGTGWPGNKHQTVDICLTGDATIEITQSGEGKAQFNFLEKEEIVYEPAQHVFVIGDFNNWTVSNEYQMKQDGNYFWLEIDSLTPQKEYAMQYLVVRADGVTKKLSDLYSEKVLHSDDQWEPKKVDPTLKSYPNEADGYATVLQTAKPKFQWSDATLNFKRPDKNNLVIYETWVYDHTAERTIEAMTNRMFYYEDLGVNAIELMPVQEFDGNLNWGYSPNHYFAFDKAYGTPEQLKTFIDECHKRGIAVILDMVFNHATGLNPMNKLYPYGDDLKKNPWFNVTAPHGDNVYEDWNHDFEPAHQMFIRALQYWLTEYKVDGFRLDLSHGLCGTQGGTSVRNIKDYYEKGVKAVSPDAYMILEHWGDNMMADRAELVKAGMMCWENTTEAYYASAKGHTTASFTNANKDGYVSYCESHDEERSFFHAKQFGVGDLQTNDSVRILTRVPLNMAFLTLLNGPQMFYHFAEFGFDYSKWQSATGKWGKDDSGKSPYDMKNVSSENYKMQVKARTETWLGEGAWRTAAFHKVGQAIQLRTKLMPQVFEGNPSKVDITGKVVRTIQWGSDVFVAGNFSATDTKTVTIPAGKWYNYYEQKEQTETTITLAPGALVILTGTQQKLPEMRPYYSFNTDVENVFIPDLSTEIQPPYNATIYTLSGQVVSVQRNVEQVDINALNRGLYLIQYEKNGQRVTKKVIR